MSNGRHHDYVQIVEEVETIGGGSTAARHGFWSEIASVRGTGRFQAHMHNADGSRTPGPAGVAIEDALDWARQLAPVIVVQIVDEPNGLANFSAGTRSPAADEYLDLRDWPQDGGLRAAKRVVAGDDDTEAGRLDR